MIYSKFYCARRCRPLFYLYIRPSCTYLAGLCLSILGYLTHGQLGPRKGDFPGLHAQVARLEVDKVRRRLTKDEQREAGNQRQASS